MQQFDPDDDNIYILETCHSVSNGNLERCINAAGGFATPPGRTSTVI
ncbi:MAG: hypothetical protein WKF77_32115 [Planctomycetaceae bacterium]